MPAAAIHAPAPQPFVFEVGLREISQLFRGRVVHCRGAYLVPAHELLVETARPGGHELVALEKPSVSAAYAPGRTCGPFEKKGPR
jgi:hypothetical protein